MSPQRVPRMSFDASSSLVVPDEEGSGGRGGYGGFFRANVCFAGNQKGAGLLGQEGDNHCGDKGDTEAKGGGGRPVGVADWKSNEQHTLHRGNSNFNIDNRILKK